MKLYTTYVTQKDMTKIQHNILITTFPKTNKNISDDFPGYFRKYPNENYFGKNIFVMFLYLFS